MRIRTQLILTVIIFGIILVIVSVSAVIINQRVQEARAQESLANSSVRNADDLNYLSDNYLVYQDSTQLDRWQSVFTSFSSEVTSLHADTPEEQSLISNIQANQQRLKETFNSIVTNAGSQTQTPGYLTPALQISWSRMATITRSLTSDASRLALQQSDQANQLQRTNGFIIIGILALFLAYFIINFLLIQRRTLTALADLQTGATIIGSGNFGYRVKEHSKDEIGNLSQAFNKMAFNLQNLTTSKAELEKEVNQRKQTEEALRESEDRYRAFFENSVDAVLITSPDGSILTANPEACRMFGMTEEELIQGGREAIVDKSDPQMMQAIEERTHTGKFKGELRLKRKDGTIFIGEVSHAFFKDRNNQTRVAQVIRDITKRKRAEEALKESEQTLQKYTKELENSNKELEAFSYSVSHDLRSPLRTLDGFSEAVLADYGDKLDETGRDYLQRIRKASQTMSQLIDDILKLSRISRTEIHREKVDLSIIAKSILDELKVSQPERQTEVAIASELIVNGDKNLLQIALRNLLENAWKYTSRCRVAKIEFGSVNQKEERIYYIRDNGVGFDMKSAEKLFQPFQRLHSSKDFPGTGIGLATVQRVIRKHNGGIWVESQEGEGTTFYFTIGQVRQVN